MPKIMEIIEKKPEAKAIIHISIAMILLVCLLLTTTTIPIK